MVSYHLHTWHSVSGCRRPVCLWMPTRWYMVPLSGCPDQGHEGRCVIGRVPYDPYTPYTIHTRARGARCARATRRLYLISGVPTPDTMFLHNSKTFSRETSVSKVDRFRFSPPRNKTWGFNKSYPGWLLIGFFAKYHRNYIGRDDIRRKNPKKVNRIGFSPSRNKTSKSYKSAPVDFWLVFLPFLVVTI